MGRLIILARYWNDMDMLQASLDQINYWDADVVILSEGAWDKNFEPRSTDGTREFLENYAKKRNNVLVIDNVRKDDNYRINQASTSNLAMKLADWQSDDWMLIIDVDHFYTKKDIDAIKKMMQEENCDYFTHKVNNFFYDLQHCQETVDTTQSRLPTRLIKGCYWIATNHLTLNGIFYKDAKQIRKKVLSNIQGFHYEGLRLKSRLDLRYSVGDRKTFWEYRNGIRLKNVVPFAGIHPEFAKNVFKKHCIFPKETLEFVKLHCNMDITQYNNPPEIESVKKYFEEKSPKNVLEIGCGLGRSSVGFYKAFPSWKNTHFYLLDGDSGKTQICNVNYETHNSFYNKLALTKKFCLANGIPPEQICILNAEQAEPFLFVEGIMFDFVYSFLAIGFHWPIGLYLNKLLSHLYSGSILCFGIRPAYNYNFCAFNEFQVCSIPQDKFGILEMTMKDSYNSRLVLMKK